ncbi:MAG: translation initiation factor IF-2, partial [Planctomycetes bacterium]|nr:translation initiation factor IF-2 [Planctomycetota bacterium]
MSEEKKKVKGATSSSKPAKPVRAKLHTTRTKPVVRLPVKLSSRGGSAFGGHPTIGGSKSFLQLPPTKEPAVTAPAKRSGVPSDGGADKIKPTSQPDIKPSAKMAEPARPVAPAKPAMPKVSPKPTPPPAPVIQTLADRIDSEDKDIRALRSSDVVYYDKAVAEKVVEEKGKIVARPTFIKGKPLLKRTFILKDQFKTRPAVRPVHKEAPERKITLTPPVTVKDISDKLGVKANVILQKLMGHNIMATINDALSEDAIILIGLEFDYDITLEQPKDTAAHLAKVVADKPEDLRPRSPIVAFMGHVDHGKTSLLDRIRKTNVAAGEAGLITQHIGAYLVESALPTAPAGQAGGKKIVFLDTPGHEAFTNMRARGANITDMVVLVVAADDGVMPQTEEAINHAKAANVAIIVAINKIDKREANVMQVKQQLSNLGLITEEWSGKTIFCEVSALTGQGVDHLLEMILLQAEMMELKANPKRNAYGTILEAKLTEEHGVLMNGLVQSGTLRPRDIISCGKAYGKVRAMFDHTLKPVSEAAPSMPVQISGLSDLPEAGDKFYVVDSLQTAKELSESYIRKKNKGTEISGRHLTLENLYSKISEDKIKEIKIIIKADVQGSVEVLAALLDG